MTSRDRKPNPARERAIRAYCAACHVEDAKRSGADVDRKWAAAANAEWAAARRAMEG